MGVVTTIELLRYFIQNPPRHTIIFLLNNFEEGGLLGAKSFIQHPWYASVKLFINLGNSFSFRLYFLYSNFFLYIRRGCWCWW